VRAVEERASARSVWQRVFAGADLTAEYPLAFDARSGGETITIEEAGETRAACTTLVREFRVGERRIRAGLIGSVASDPDWRRRGLGTRLLAEAERSLAARGSLFALLWATDPGYYLARGYAPLGAENDFLLDTELVTRLPEASGVRELRAGDAPLLHRLHANHPARVERSVEEMRALLAVPGVRTIVRERSVAAGHPPLPVAYACLGRGRDLADTIHEWAGASADVLALIRAHLERRFTGEAGALFLMAPPQASDLAYRLIELGAVTKRGILGLGKLLSVRDGARLLGELLGAPEAVEPKESGVLVRGASGQAELDLDTLLALLFGGPEVRDVARSFLERMGFPGVRLPLEPFAFGLDSI